MSDYDRLRSIFRSIGVHHHSFAKKWIADAILRTCPGVPPGVSMVVEARCVDFCFDSSGSFMGMASGYDFRTWDPRETDGIHLDGDITMS